MVDLTIDDLKKQIKLFEAIANYAAAVIGAKDLQGRYLFVNQEYSRLFHIDQEDFYGKTDYDLFSVEIASAFRKADLQVIEKNDVVILEEQALVDGELRDFLSVKFPIRDPNDLLFATGLVATDITERKKNQLEMERLALTDQLTGLVNRSAFNQYLSDALKRAVRHKKLVGLAILDLDKFKPVNDEYGHLAGDAILKEVATRLLKIFREVDTVARIGGDEFTIIFDDIVTMDNSTLALERAVEVLCEPYYFENNIIKIGASIGIAFYPHHGNDINSLLRSADNALYEAKEKGRNQVQIASI